MVSEHPAATAVRDYESRSEPSERFDALILAFEILLRVDACVLAAIFLTLEECRDSKVSDLLLTSSKSFTLGTWLELLRALAHSLPKQAASGLIDWVRRLSEGRKLLALRNRRSHEESRTEESITKDILARAEPLFRRSFDSHPTLGRVALAGSGRLAVEIGGVSFPGGPLLLSGTVIGRPDVVLLYRGSGHDVLEYGSLSGFTHQDPAAYVEILERLREKGSRLDMVSGHQARHFAASRMEQHTRDTLKRLIDLHRYRPEIAIDRTELDLKLESFLDSQRCLMIVQGASGSGKTFWLCRVAEQRLHRGYAVLFETADRLTSAVVPEIFATMLRVKDFRASAEAAAQHSQDGKVVVIIDALDSWGREAELLLSLFYWVERIDSPRQIKILATIRAERWWLFSDQHEAALPGERFLEQSMPSLSLYSLQELARKLQKPSDVEAEILEAARLETARRIYSLAYDSSLQPGLAVAILEADGASLTPSSFSAARVYEELFRRVVLKVVESPPDQPWRASPRQPWRARILKGIAVILLARTAERVALEDAELEKLHLIEPATDQRSIVYSGLLSDRILAEILDGLSSYILFIDQRFFEFVASLTLPDGEPSEVLTELYKKWGRYPPALAVAAFYLTRVIGGIGTVAAVGAVQEVSNWLEPLLLELASVEGETFLNIFKPLADRLPETAFALLDRLTEKGEPRLAVRAAEIMVERLLPESDLEVKVRYLKARALYEIDDYRSAEEEIERLRDRIPLDGFRAEIALSRGHLGKALQDYEDILKKPDLSPGEKADALSGVGYIQYLRGDLQSAEARFREALALLDSEDSVLLAEILGDLGQVLMADGRLDLARQCFEQDFLMCQRIGHSIGVCVAESLLAKVSFLEGSAEEAEIQFRNALRLARQIGNRWREAWILKGFAEVCRALNRLDEAEAYLSESSAIHKNLGIVDA